jgi:hypothetical protein
VLRRPWTPQAFFRLQSLLALLALMTSLSDEKKSYVNVTRRELYMMQQMVAPPEERETIWDRKRELQKKSTARVSKWPNTLAARRKHKEEARSVRLAELEAGRRVNDKKLAKERAVDRQRRIDRANRTIYERTDRMKVLRSKRMSVDILKHRAIQIRQKKQFSTIDTEIEKLWHSETIRQCAEYDKKESAAVLKVKARDKEIAVIQTKQLEDYKDRYIEQLLQERDEGIEIAKQAVAGAEKDRQKDLRARLAAKKNMMDTLAGNEELKKMRSVFAAKIAKEDAAIAKYAKDKEDRVKMRREREQEQFDRAQAKRQAIIDAAVELMAKNTNQEQTRLEAQQAEFARKEEDAFKLKAEKQRLMKEAIDESRRIQLEMKAKKKASDQAMADEMGVRWKARNVQLDQEERNERKDKMSRAKAHQKFLLQQARSKRNEEQEHKDRLLRDARLQKRLDDEEEGKFFDEVRKTIAEMKSENPNLNLIPVKSCFNLKEGLMEAM